MVILIITEKPSSAVKIAQALAEGKAEKKIVNKIAYYELHHKGKHILVGCAVGHLYNLHEKNKKGCLVLPVTFDRCAEQRGCFDDDTYLLPV